MQKILKIDWNDTCSSDGWECVDCVDPKPIMCHSVGYVVKRTKQAITVSGTIGDHGANCQYITIPKGCIIKVTELKDARP